jgi:glycosyltransferase involved in cell wall biosynthesis
MKVGVIITTYNWTEALVKVLGSIIDQSCLPDEVVVCDDGSQIECKNYILDLFKNFPCVLKYVWQEDKGFRAAAIRNKGINILGDSIEYVIVIDGDMILHKNFIKDHMRLSKKNCFIQGGRALISKNKTSEILKDSLTYNYFHLFSPGLSNRLNTLYMPFISNFFETPNKKLKGIRTCNMSFWKRDLFGVNGFNEDFIGWGREDSELVVRLFNSGIMRKNIKFSGLAFHLFHEESPRLSISKNDNLLSKAIKSKLSYCTNGITNQKQNES